MKNHPIFELPPYKLGPYQMKFVSSPREDFIDRRCKVENHWTHGIVRISDDLDYETTVRYVLRQLVVACYHRSGLTDKSDEEAYTHAVAAGFVELAQRNPDFWVPLQGMFAKCWAPDEAWEATAAGLPAAEVSVLPDLLRCGRKTCEPTWIPATDCETVPKKGAFGYYYLRSRRIELSNGLFGPNLAVVTFHEALHFVHQCAGLNDKSKWEDFRNALRYHLPRFIAQNPQFWHWFLDKARRLEPQEKPRLDLRNLPPRAELNRQLSYA